MKTSFRNEHIHTHKKMLVSGFREMLRARFFSSMVFFRFLLTEWHVLISFLFHNKCEFTGSYIICNYEHTEQPELCSTAMGGWKYFLLLFSFHSVDHWSGFNFAIYFKSCWIIDGICLIVRTIRTIKNKIHAFAIDPIQPMEPVIFLSHSLSHPDQLYTVRTVPNLINCVL